MPGWKSMRQPEAISLCGTALLSLKSKNSGSNPTARAAGGKHRGGGKMV